MTIGSDGYIRVWDFETVDTADITDESNVFEMEPMNELQVQKILLQTGGMARGGCPWGDGGILR